MCFYDEIQSFVVEFTHLVLSVFKLDPHRCDFVLQIHCDFVDVALISGSFAIFVALFVTTLFAWRLTMELQEPGTLLPFGRQNPNWSRVYREYMEYVEARELDHQLTMEIQDIVRMEAPMEDEASFLGDLLKDDNKVEQGVRRNGDSTVRCTSATN